MRYRVSLAEFTVEADDANAARLEAVQTVLESPDLFTVNEEDGSEDD